MAVSYLLGVFVLLCFFKLDPKRKVRKRCLVYRNIGNNGLLPLTLNVLLFSFLFVFGVGKVVGLLAKYQLSISESVLISFSQQDHSQLLKNGKHNKKEKN